MQGEFRQGWKVVAASAIGVGCGLTAIPFYTLGVFVGPLSAEFGWDRGQIMLGFGMMIAASLLSAPIVGYFSDKHGVRPVALISIVLFAVLLASFSLITDELWTFYLCWLLLALFAAGTTPITWTRAVNSWFDKNRGAALGLALCGTGIAAAIFPYYTTKLIENFGVRGAYIGLGLTVIIVAFPTVFLWFSERKDDEGDTAKMLLAGKSVSDALKDHKFWITGLALFIISGCVAGLIPNMVPMLTDSGYSLETAASFAGLIGISVIIGRVVVGLLIDRFWAPMIACLFLSLPAISCIILISGVESPFLIGLAVIFIGLAAGAEFDLMAFLVSRYFGMLHYAKIYSGIYIFFALGAAIGPPVFGKVFDVAGSYSPILYVSSFLFLMGSVMLLFLGRYPDLAKEAHRPA